MIFRTPWGKSRDFPIEKVIEMMRDKKISASKAICQLGGSSDWSWATPDGPELYHITHGIRAIGHGANVLAVENTRRFGAIAELVAFHNLAWEEANERVACAEADYNQRNKEFQEFLGSPEGLKEYLEIEQTLDPGKVWQSSTVSLTVFNSPHWARLRKERDTGWHSWNPSTAVLDIMKQRHSVPGCVSIPLDEVA